MSVLPQNPYSEQQDPKVEPAQVCPLREPHWPFPETGKLTVGVLAAEEETDDATVLSELADVAAQELTKSVTTVVAVTPPVMVSVTVCSAPVGPGTLTVVVVM